jgi:hypothetical protein
MKPPQYQKARVVAAGGLGANLIGGDIWVQIGRPTRITARQQDGSIAVEDIYVMEHESARFVAWACGERFSGGDTIQVHRDMVELLPEFK